jgi:hypothetical protein
MKKIRLGGRGRERKVGRKGEGGELETLHPKTLIKHKTLNPNSPFQDV